MNRVFVGYDPRQPIAFTVCAHSVARHSKKPVAITPLILSQLPIKRRGLTEFTFSRFLVPYLCDFKGKAFFMDADMIVTGDITELFEREDMNAVSVMQAQERFEWPSAMMFNCGSCLKLTPAYIDNPQNVLFDLAWANYIGELPTEWNQIVGYGPTKPSKLYHYTRGIPIWSETQGEIEDELWCDELDAANYTCEYADLMGKSIHAERPRNIVLEGEDATETH